MSIAEIEGGCAIIRPKAIAYKCGGQTSIALMGDLHIGSAATRISAIKADLEMAKACGARVLINGDVMECIFPADSKRFNPADLAPELRGRNDVLNATLDLAYGVLAPYASLIDMIGVGNHETATAHYHSADIGLMLADKLGVPYGGMCGFVDYRFQRSGGGGQRYVIFYHHGAGGSAPVTKGMIDFHRSRWIDADLVWFGHKHTRIQSHELSMRCPESGDQPVMRDRRFVITGSYSQTYHGQSQNSFRQHGRLSNYAADKLLAPNGCGGAVVQLTHKRDGMETRITQ